MTDLELDENLQPIFKPRRDYAVVDGRKEFEQWVRLQAQERLYGIEAEYASEDVKHKIKFVLSQLARESNYVNSVEGVEVTNLQKDPLAEKTGYEAKILYNESESLIQQLEGL